MLLKDTIYFSDKGTASTFQKVQEIHKHIKDNILPHHPGKTTTDSRVCLRPIF